MQVLHGFCCGSITDIGLAYHIMQLWSGVLAQQVPSLAHQDQIAQRHPVTGVNTAEIESKHTSVTASTLTTGLKSNWDHTNCKSLAHLAI